MLLILLIVFLLFFFCVPDIRPYEIEDNFDIYTIAPVSGTEFQSEDLKIGEKTAFVYATLSEKTALDNKDEYIITVGEVKGIKSNRYEMFSVGAQEDKAILSNEYINIVDIPEHGIKKGKSYYGSVYVGTVPIDCESVEIQGNQATLVEQSFELNGKPAHFYLYYCAVEETEFPDAAVVKCTDKNGNTFDIGDN